MSSSLMQWILLMLFRCLRTASRHCEVKALGVPEDGKIREKSVLLKESTIRGYISLSDDALKSYGGKQSPAGIRYPSFRECRRFLLTLIGEMFLDFKTSMEMMLEIPLKPICLCGGRQIHKRLITQFRADQLRDWCVRATAGQSFII